MFTCLACKWCPTFWRTGRDWGRRKVAVCALLSSCNCLLRRSRKCAEDLFHCRRFWLRWLSLGLSNRSIPETFLNFMHSKVVMKRFSTIILHLSTIRFMVGFLVHCLQILDWLLHLITFNTSACETRDKTSLLRVVTQIEFKMLASRGLSFKLVYTLLYKRIIISLN